MATLDDKLLGEKLHYYCSSSEDEDGRDDDDRDDKEVEKEPKPPSFIPQSELAAPSSSGGANTGPKGVIEDWRRFKQLQREERRGREREQAALAKKLAMTCRTDKEDEEAELEAERKDKDGDDDAFLADYMRRRMQEMMAAAAARGDNRVSDVGGGNKRFGALVTLADGGEFLNAIDSEPEGAPVVVAIVSSSTSPDKSCARLTHCLGAVAADYPAAKFCSVAADAIPAAGLSDRFRAGGVPAILVYRRGELVSSFVRVTDILGDAGDFYPSDVESLLVEHGVLQDKELVPRIVRGGEQTDQDDDSD